MSISKNAGVVLRTRVHVSVCDRSMTYQQFEKSHKYQKQGSRLRLS